MIIQSQLIAGVDESGRGPLAGPVFAAAVILNTQKPILGLADSKKLTPKKRTFLASEIRQYAIAWAVGRAEVDEIDRINIFQASLLAMERAVSSLDQVPNLVLVDGQHCPRLDYPSRTIVRGDQTVLEISAASILAKVYRDAEMLILDAAYPGYGFAQHKGYATTEHLELLEKLGPTNIHRRSFSPVRNILTRYKNNVK